MTLFEMYTHKNTAPYSISLGTANVYTALTPLYKNNVYILYPASKGLFDLPDFSWKIKGTLLAGNIFSSSHAFLPIAPSKRNYIGPDWVDCVWELTLV